MESKPLKVGFWSRLDYGGDDYRVGLWNLAAEIFAAEKVSYICLVGGLIDAKAVETRLGALLKGLKSDEREAVRESFIKEIVNFLKEKLPSIRGVKIYIITSPAYDGKLGHEVA